MYSLRASSFVILPSLFQASLSKGRQRSSPKEGSKWGVPFHALHDLQAARSGLIARSSRGLLEEAVEAQLEVVGDILDGRAWTTKMGQLALETQIPTSNCRW